MLQKDGTIPWRTSYEHDAIFSLSVNNIKISKRDGVEVSNRMYERIHEIKNGQDILQFHSWELYVK